MVTGTSDLGRDMMRFFICPSNFTKAHHDELWISHLEDVEIWLQEGEAQDALRDLRTPVRNINSLTFQQKQSKSIGQDATLLRANEVINPI